MMQVLQRRLTNPILLANWDNDRAMGIASELEPNSPTESFIHGF
jgi:hypothetical protein